MDTSKQSFKKNFIIILAVLSILISVTFTILYINNKLTSQSEKIHNLQIQLNTQNNQLLNLSNQFSNLDMFALQVKVGLLGKVEERFNKNLELEKQILLEKINTLNNETEKIKEIIAQLYKYNQTIEIQLPPEQKSKAEKISSTLGDIVKGFIF